MTIYYVKPNAGTGSQDGSSFANAAPTVATVTGAAGGDTIKVMKTSDATSMSQNATFTNKSATVTLTSAVTANITLDGAWTASANVTCTTSSTRKEGSNSSSIAIASGFTTGLAAYKAFTATDFSSYQQISFWIQANATVSGSVLRVDLCSDNAGVTAVDSFTITRALAQNAWTSFTMDKGSALGSSIQSVALTCLSDPGTVTILIDDVIACKSVASADSLNLNSLIGKNDGIWWPIMSINGTTVVIDEDPAQAASSVGRGYSGTTASTTIYKREVQSTAAAATASTVVDRFAGTSGTAGNVVTISGGWNTTDMTTQTGETFLTGNDGLGIGFDMSGKNYVTLSKLGLVRYTNGFTCPRSGGSSSTNNIIDSCWSIGNTTNGIEGQGSATASDLDKTIYNTICNCNGNAGFNNLAAGGGMTISSVKALSNGGVGASLSTSNIYHAQFINVVANNNASGGVQLASTALDCYNVTTNDNNNIGFSITGGNQDYHVENLTSSGNINYGLQLNANCAGGRVSGYTSSSNSTASINANSIQNALFYIQGSSMSESTKVANLTGLAGRIYSHRESNTATSNTIYTSLGNIVTDTSTKNSGSVSWKMSPSASTTSTKPLRMSVGKFAAKASTSITVTYYCRRDSTNLTAGLRIFGGRYPGVGSAGTDVTTNVNPTANTWDDFSISCTPTEDCVIEIFYEAYNTSGTNNCWIDGDVTVA